MKKFQALFILLISVCFLLLAVGCANERPQFGFSYEMEQTEYSRGDTIEITTTFTNTGRTYKYVGSSSACSAVPEFYRMTEEHGKYVIFEYHRTETADLTTIHLKKSESRSQTVHIIVPEDAPLGEYTLQLTFAGVCNTFEQAITIVE